MMNQKQSTRVRALVKGCPAFKGLMSKNAPSRPNPTPPRRLLLALSGRLADRLARPGFTRKADLPNRRPPVRDCGTNFAYRGAPAPRRQLATNRTLGAFLKSRKPNLIDLWEEGRCTAFRRHRTTESLCIGSSVHQPLGRWKKFMAVPGNRILGLRSLVGAASWAARETNDGR